MLCDTCIYKDCEGISCSECKFLRRSETIYGSPSEINNLHTVTLIGKANDNYDKTCIICEDVKWG